MDAGMTATDGPGSLSGNFFSGEISEPAHGSKVDDGIPESSECNGLKAPTAKTMLSSIKPEDVNCEKRTRKSDMMENLEAQFSSFCEAVTCLDEKTRHDATRLLHETKPLLVAPTSALGSGTEDQMVRVWSVCILYCASRLSPDSAEAARCKLSYLLGVFNVSIWDFFRELPQFLQKADSTLEAVYGNVRDRLRQVKELQVNFVHLTVLFNYYKKNYCSLFLLPHTAKNSSSLATSDGTLTSCDHLQFGWMLFLALRSHVLTQFDLVTCTNGLIAVLAILVIHMPVHLRNSNKSEMFAVRSCASVKVVSSLCYLYEASEEDVQKMVDKAVDMITEILHIPYDSKLPNNVEELADVDKEGLMYFKDLLEESSLQSYLEILNKDYEDIFKQRGELDERLFLCGDDGRVGLLSDSMSLLDDISNSDFAKRKHETMMSPVKSTSSKTNIFSPYESPRPSPIKASSTKMLPPTPITSTLTSAKWLRTVIAPLSIEPSSDLLHFLRSCDTDITKQVKFRAQVLLDSIFRSERPASWGLVGGLNGRASLDSIWAEQRQTEALKLYYRVLGSMCRAESQRLHCYNLSALLINERFHRCMLACSAELVLATYKTVSLNFPAVLEPIGITAFDAWKVIESFVRHEESLPRELKRHLNAIEEKILEKLAWEKGSSMYNSLIVAKPHLQSEIYRLDLLAEAMPSLDSLQARYQLLNGTAAALLPSSKPEIHLGENQGSSSPLCKIPNSSKGALGTSSSIEKLGSGIVTPVKEQSSGFSTFAAVKARMQPSLQSAFASPQKPSPVGGGETCAETVILVFFQKVLKLAAIRIKVLCESLKQSHLVMEDVYKTVQHIVYHETNLFFRRHIDQIILCSTYGVCKVKQLSVTFKQIVQHYKQNHHDSHIYQTVFFNLPSAKPLVKGGQGTRDIITFYNAIFVPSIKGFLTQLNNETASDTDMTDEGEKFDGLLPGSPGPSPFSSLPDMSPKKVSANHNVYVSPLRSAKMESLRSPHSRSLYACVGESRHAYQSPSKDLTDINKRVNSRRLGRLDFGDKGLVSDSLVAGSLYTCNMSTNTNNLKTESVLSQSQSISWSNSMQDTLPSKRLCTDR